MSKKLNKEEIKKAKKAKQVKLDSKLIKK